MTKLVLKEAYRKVGKRTYSLVQCPSCSSTRDVRVDALKDQQSTLCRSCVNRARTNNGKTGKFNRLDHYRTLASWDKPITLKNNISIEEIYDTVSKHS